MISLRYISWCDVCYTYKQGVIVEILIPLFGISVGIIVPLAVFYWQYHETKHKNETIIEISKNIDDPSKLEDLLHMLDERKKEPIDYRRGGIITIFVGLGICLLGYTAMGSFFVGIGYLVGAIGMGTMVAGYLYPNTGEELTNAVEEFERK
jgi:hypothetical protein